MHLHTVVTILGCLISLATERYSALAAPETIRRGEHFEALLVGEHVYIQSIYDVAVGLGVIDGKRIPRSLGRTVLDSFYIGPGECPGGDEQSMLDRGWLTTGLIQSSRMTSTTPRFTWECRTISGTATPPSAQRCSVFGVLDVHPLSLKRVSLLSWAILPARAMSVSH